MSGAFEMCREPRSRWNSMLADLAPMLLLRDGVLTTAATVCLPASYSGLSDVYSEFLVCQKLRLVGECEIADSAFVSLIFQGVVPGRL